MIQRIHTRKDELVETLHGVQVPDPYRWLEGDPNEPELNTWLEEQAKRASDYFHSVPVRDQLRDEFKKLFERDSVSLPDPKQNQYFFEKRLANEDMAVLYVKEGLNGTPKVLINPNTLSPDQTIVLSDWEPSRDGKLLAYELSASGNDKSDIRVLDVDSGEDLPDMIPDDVYPEMDSWNFEGTGFWYSRRDPSAPEEEAKLHRRTFFHTLGTAMENDELVWGSDFSKESIVWVRLSPDGRYLMGGVYGQEDGKEWTEIYIKDLKEGGDFVRVLERSPGSLAYGHLHRDRLYVYTNNGAPKWKVIATDISTALAGKAEFKDILAEGEDVLEEYALADDTLFAAYLHNVHTVIHEYTLDGTFVRDTALPAMGTAGGFSCEPDGREVFFMFSSFAYPPTVYRIDLDTNEVQVIEKLKTTFDTEQIETKQVWYESKDGVRIPMYLVYRKGLERNGTNPTLLYGYGGFSISLSPSYMSSSVPFIERGGIFAIANLRGGGEFGEEWHKGGMQKNKQNVFNDFIAAAEYLISEKYTQSNKLAITGGSNGGLLVAAAMTQRPELFGAVVSRVPVADMLRYHLHHGGIHWVPDYGNPDDPDMFAYLLGYSPYHNVKDGEKYPATLITTSDGDDRVHPLHAYKFAARLEEANAPNNPTLMRVERKAGHSGAAALSRSIEEDADVWSFIFDQLGMVQSHA